MEPEAAATGAATAGAAAAGAATAVASIAAAASALQAANLSCAHTFCLILSMSSVDTFIRNRMSRGQPSLRPAFTRLPFTVHCTLSTSKGFGWALGGIHLRVSRFNIYVYVCFAPGRMTFTRSRT